MHHTYMATFQTPKGSLEWREGDSDSLRIEGLDLGRGFPKYSYWQRWRQEREYGRLLATMIERERPDVFLASNTPLDMLAVVQKTCRRLGVRFVFWVQDLYGYAIAKILGPRYGGLGKLIGQHYLRLEKRLLAASQHAVAITEDFRPFLREAGLPDASISVIPNWAPLEEMPQRDKDNPWSRAQGLDQAFVFLYSGTLGLKHNPGLLLELALAFRDDPMVRVVVVSEGIGADWLREAAARAGLDNLLLLPFQPFKAMPEVLGSAEVLIAVLEQSAGVFSVPSKILTYLCAGRPILLAAPGENQAARLLAEVGAGIVCKAGKTDALLAAARKMWVDAALRATMGACGRGHAEQKFHVQTLAQRFEALLT